MTPPQLDGHVLAPAPVSPLALVLRWTCGRCGREVLGCAGRFWGPAVDEVCIKDFIPTIWGPRLYALLTRWSPLWPTPADANPFPLFRPFRWLPQWRGRR